MTAQPVAGGAQDGGQRIGCVGAVECRGNLRPGLQSALDGVVVGNAQDAALTAIVVGNVGLTKTGALPVSHIFDDSSRDGCSRSGKLLRTLGVRHAVVYCAHLPSGTCRP